MTSSFGSPPQTSSQQDPDQQHTPEQKVYLSGPGQTGAAMAGSAPQQATNNGGGGGGGGGAFSEKEAYDIHAYSGIEVVENNSNNNNKAPVYQQDSYPEAVVVGAGAGAGAGAGVVPPPLVHSTPSYPADYQYQQQQQHQNLYNGHNPGAAGTAYQYQVSGGFTNNNNNSTNGGYAYNNGGNPFDTPKNGPASSGGSGRSRKADKICGLRRKAFWVVLAVIIFALLAAIAVGLGLGLSQRNASSHTITNSSKSSSTSSTSSTSPTATSSSSSSSSASSSTTTTSSLAPTATATADATTDIVCPSANLTLYSVTLNSSSSTTSSSKNYLVLCGRDYNSDGGAVDLTNVNTTTFEECLNECGLETGCIAVGWGNYYGTNTCWLKSNVGTPNESDNWYAAIEYDD